MCVESGASRWLARGFGDVAQGPESVVRQQGVAGVVRRAQRGRDVPVVSCVLRWGQLQCVCVEGLSLSAGGHNNHSTTSTEGQYHNNGDTGKKRYGRRIFGVS